MIWLHFLWRESLWAVYLQLLKLLFHYVRIISSFKLFFKFISAVHFRPVQFGSVIWKAKYLKLKTPWSRSFRWSIVNMELAPSFTIIFSYPLLSHRKISSPCTSPRLSSEFFRTIQFSNCLLVCHYHDFSPKQLRSSEPFLIYLSSLYDSFIMSKTN